MTQVYYVGFALLLGLGGSIQIAMISAMGRMRGSTESALLSITATIMGLFIVLSIRALSGNRPMLQAPLDRTPMLLLLVLATGVIVAIAARGLEPYYATTGLLAVPFLIGAGFLGPRLGLALFLGATIAGQMGGSVFLDHIGAFGSQAREVNLMKVAGVAVLIAGVAIVQRAR